MTNAVDVSIVIVNWNTRECLRDCLASIYAQTRHIVFEVVVVDNASEDGSAAMVRAQFPQVRLIENRENRGFAAANNQGIAMVHARYVLLLNPDTVVLDGAVQKIVAYADEHRDAGVVGCQVWMNETEIQRTCFSFPSVWDLIVQTTGLHRVFPRSRLFGRALLGWWDRLDEREVDVVSGMFMLVRREAIEDVGVMDEDYFVYTEETDWCYRFKQAGWRCLFTPVARIIHLDGGSKSTDQVSVKMYVQLHKSLLIFFRKRLGWWPWAMARVLLTASMICRAAAWGILVGARRDPKARHRWRQSTAVLWFLVTGRQPQ